MCFGTINFRCSGEPGDWFARSIVPPASSVVLSPKVRIGRGLYRVKVLGLNFIYSASLLVLFYIYEL